MQHRCCLSALLFFLFVLKSIAGDPVLVLEEENIIFSPNAKIVDQFGLSNAIHNGVIAVSDPSNRLVDTLGAVFLFDSATGALLKELNPEDGTLDNAFGWQIDLDDAYLVAATSDSAGSIYIFDISTGVQIHEFELPGSRPQKQFYGPAIAIDNGVIAIGGPGLSRGEDGSGIVFIYDAKTGLQKFEIAPDIADPDEIFGLSVAINNDFIAAWSYTLAQTTNLQPNAIYVFNANDGALLHKLQVDSRYGYFGWDIAIENTKLVASAPFEVFEDKFADGVYVFDLETGNQVLRFENPGPDLYDYFGESIDISNDKIAVGSRGLDTYGNDYGGAYIFDATTGEQVASLVPRKKDLVSVGAFGSNVAIENGVVLVNAPSSKAPGTIYNPVYIFNINCPADFNEDYQLDLVDVNQFVLDLTNNESTADLNNDGNFDYFDVSAFLAAFVQGCPG